jgi:hypothetical protein
MQLYLYFMSQSSEFCRHNTLCGFSTSNTTGKRIFRYDSVRKLLDTPLYLTELWRLFSENALLYDLFIREVKQWTILDITNGELPDLHSHLMLLG